jgi:BirA family biotin operon repressor/biotin-[acetyl-CoA-carboxylase] ligase
MSNIKTLFYNELTSTNDTLRELRNNEEASHGTAIMAGFQNKGKGQSGNEWHSLPNKNMLLSVFVKPKQLEIENSFLLSMVVSLSILKVLHKFEVSAQIKWPNDILVNCQKICGILIENSLVGNLISDSIIGIGLNVNQEKFPKFNPTATSLKLEKQVSFDNAVLAEEVKLELLKGINELVEENYTRIKLDYLKNLFGFETKLLYRDKYTDFFGKIKDVSFMGPISIEKENGEQLKYFFKEVQLLKF